MRTLKELTEESMKNYMYYPNLTENPEYVLYNKEEDKILQEHFNRPPRIYGVSAEARKQTRLNKGYSVVNVQDLPDHQQDFLIREYNQNLKHLNNGSNN
jgi:hypothetical protein